MQAGVGDLARWMLSLTDGATNGPVAPPFELPGGIWPNKPLPNIAAAAERLRRLLAESRKIDQAIRTKWPELMKEELDQLQRRDVTIQDAMTKLPR